MACQKISTRDPREKSITEDPEKEPITEDSGPSMIFGL